MKTVAHSHRNRRGRFGFTLIELLMAMVGAAMILSAIYGVFSRAVRLRDNATERARETRLRMRAETVLRNDLRNAIISGGVLAATLKTTSDAAQSRFPGYLRFTTTTGRDTVEEYFGDVQEVEYSIASDPESPTGDAGVLTRRINRALLAEVREVTHEEPLLTGVVAMEVEFSDGQSWTDTWEMSDAESELPAAVRVRIYQATGTGQERSKTPIEILVPWTTQRGIPSSSSTTEGAEP